MTYPSPWSHSASRARFQTFAVYLACNATKHDWHKKLEDDCLVGGDTHPIIISTNTHVQIRA